MNNERYISNISTNQMCHRTTKLFMTDFLQNEVYESNVMLVKVNEINNLL